MKSLGHQCVNYINQLFGFDNFLGKNTQLFTYFMQESFFEKKNSLHDSYIINIINIAPHRLWNPIFELYWFIYQDQLWNFLHLNEMNAAKQHYLKILQHHQYCQWLFELVYYEQQKTPGSLLNQISITFS